MHKLAFVLALAAGGVAAQEPLTLFGIPFNEPLSLPECRWETMRSAQPPHEQSREYVDLGWEGMCFSRLRGIGEPVDDASYSIHFPREEAPSMGKVSVEVVDGRIQELSVITDGPPTQERVLRDLTVKFGAPQSINRPTGDKTGGGVYEAIEAEWMLSDGTHASFRSGLNNLQVGAVIISTEELIRARKGLGRLPERARQL